MKEHVKQYLKKRGVDPNSLPPKTKAALDSLSPTEVKVLDQVGVALDEDGVPSVATARAVH